MIMNTYGVAVRYAALGWSVIPLKPNSKVPLIPWQQYQQRLSTQTELKEWFMTSQNNIGICTGALSNLSVLDVDELKTLPQLQTSSSITVITKHGKHLYFKYSNERNSQSKIADAIDVRGEGGFVVAPPSVVDGHRYRFLSPVITPMLLRPFPRELLNEPTTISTGTYIKKPADWISNDLLTLGKGEPRNVVLRRVIGAMHRARFSSDTILLFLSPHADRVGFALDRLEKLISEGMKYENGHKESDALHPSGDKDETLEAFMQGEEETKWIIKPVVADPSITFMAGLPESLKSWLLLDMSIECARGGEWLGLKAKKCRVLFIDQERFRDEIKGRVRKLLKGKGLTIQDVKDNLIIKSGTTYRLDIPESFEVLKRKLQMIRPNVLILDSFVTFHFCSENDRTEVQKVLEKVKELRTEFGCAVIFVDHEGKSVLNPENRGETPTAFSIVGSVGKPAAAEIVLTVRKETANSVIVYHTKSTMAPAMPPIAVKVIDTEDGGIRLEHF